MAMTQKERMLAGELYVADDPELVADAARAAGWLDRYNRASTATVIAKKACPPERCVTTIGAGDASVLPWPSPIQQTRAQ
ncbi:maltose acetyltransferase domain-containing protein [Sphingomonas aerolata]|uniref:maltose acetyltransferase domain-containing protein n=1 Tax=Sphingomonas aerolata TaxID=185951 RepID=UPI00141BE999|nr:maltose acetyltransferase domain-containing protein [Sphingomonas aerolata]NII58591.1 maltose O-acetyltransferase [Sphingomonas aerolata]